MTETKVTYQLSGDGFYREHTDLVDALEWLDYFRKQGRANIRLVATTTTREVLYPDDGSPRDMRVVCGACSEERHADCSGWCLHCWCREGTVLVRPEGARAP